LGARAFLPQPNSYPVWSTTFSIKRRSSCINPRGWEWWWVV